MFEDYHARSEIMLNVQDIQYTYTYKYSRILKINSESSTVCPRSPV